MGKRGKGKRRAAAATDGEETMINGDLDVGDVSDEPFDRAAFLNNPLSEKQLTKLQAFASDTKVPLSAYKEDVMETMKRLAGNMAEFLKTNQDKVVHTPGPVYVRLRFTLPLGSRRTRFDHEGSDGC
jgi:hypothetical protein